MRREYTTSEANISSVSQYDNYRESGAELKFIFCSVWFIDWLESVVLPLKRLQQENRSIMRQLVKCSLQRPILTLKNVLRSMYWKEMCLLIVHK